MKVSAPIVEDASAVVVEKNGNRLAHGEDVRVCKPCAIDMWLQCDAGARSRSVVE